MTVVGTIEYDAKLNSDDFRRGAREVDAEAATVASRLNRTLGGFKDFSRGASDAFTSVSDGLGKVLKATTLVVGTGSFGFMGMAKAAWTQVSAVEQATVALNAYEKDSGKVSRTLSELIEYARSDLGVLFQRQDLFAAAQGLKVMGAETNNLTKYVEIMSRSVGLGLQDWDTLGQVIGRVGSTGRLTGIDFDMLTKSGYRLDDSLRNTDITFEQLFKHLDKGIPAKAMAGQANTIRGRMIRLQTAFRTLGLSILGVDTETSKFIKGGLGDRLVKLMENLREVMSSPDMKEAMKRIGESLAGLAENVLPKLLRGLKWLANNFDLVKDIMLSLAAAFVFAKTMAIIFAIVAAANPLTIIAAAATVLVGAITYLQKRFKIFNKIIDGAKRVFGRFKEAVKDAIQFAIDLFNDVIDKVKEHKEGIEQVVGVLTVLFGPALVRIGILGMITAVKHVAAAAITAGAWVLAAVKSGAAWVVWQAKMLVINAFMLAQMTLAAAKSAAAWVVTFAIMTAKAIATGYVFFIQAAKASAIWIFHAVITAPHWIAAFARMSAAAVVHATVTSVQAARAGTAWLLQAALVSGRWLLAFGFMGAAAAKAAALMVTAGIRAAAAWLLALGPIGWVIAAIALVAAGAYLVIKHWDKVKAFFGRIGAFILEKLSNFKTLLVESGKDLIRGLINGVKSMGSAAVEAVKGVGSSIKNGFKSILGIDSPSKVFAEFGSNIMQGLSGGINRSVRLPETSMAHAANSVMSSFGSPTLRSIQSIGNPSLQAEHVSATSPLRIGTINISNEVDAERFLRRMGLDQQITSNGMTPATGF